MHRILFAIVVLCVRLGAAMAADPLAGASPSAVKTLIDQSLSVSWNTELSHDPRVCGETQSSCTATRVLGTYNGAQVFTFVDAGSTRSIAVDLRKLDPSVPTPQITIQGWSGGAHCCLDVHVATATASGEWVVVDLGDTFEAGEFIDLGDDGIQEFATSDDNFLYAFASHAGSVAPTEILKVENGHVVNATMDAAYRQKLLDDLNEMEVNSAVYKEEPNGYLAGWVAQQALLGKVDEAWPKMLLSFDKLKLYPTGCRIADAALIAALGKPNSGDCPIHEEYRDEFPTALALFLVRHGYITKQQSLGLGYNVDAVDAKRRGEISVETARYKRGWFTLAKGYGDRLECHSGSSPEALVGDDKVGGHSDKVEITKTGTGGRPAVVVVGQTKAGTQSTHLFFRGLEECARYREESQRQLDSLH